MLVPRVVQLRAHHQQLSHSHSSVGLPALSFRRASATQTLLPMASPSVDQLVVEFLRKRGLTKTLKTFVSEASYKEPKVSASVELGTVCASYFASKKEVGGKARSDTAFTNGSILKPEVKIVAKQKAESSSDDSDDSSDESEDEVKVVAPAPASKKSVSAVAAVSAAVPAKKAKAESSSSDDSSDEEEEDVKTVQTNLKVNGVKKKKVEAGVSESSSSDSDDEKEVVAATSKAKVPVVSKEEESSSDDSDDESEDEKVAAKTPPPASSKGKKTSVAAVVPKTTPNPASSSSSDSSSDDEEVGADQINAVEPIKPADDSSSEEENDVEMKSVTPAVADKKAGKPSTSSDSSDSSDDEMEVDTKPATTVKVVQKATLPKVEAKKADSSSSDSSSDEDSDDEASDEVKNVTKPASTKPAKPTVVKKVSSSSDSSSSDSSSDEEEKPKTGVRSVGSKNNTSAKIVAVEDNESDSSDESVEIKGITGGTAAAVSGKQVSSDSSSSSDSSDDEEAKVVTKPSTPKGKKSQVIKEKQVMPEPTVEKSKAKKGKKSPQENAPAAEVAQAVELVTPVIKKRKADDEEANAGHINKKANVNGIAVATATGNDESKSAQKRKQRSATKGTPSAARAFQRVKVEEVELLDDRLADNSYWAKAGAEEGWGAKAEEVLGRVRGKGFRHEKTKKKRGSYKGGVIDNASHSIKFENSDDE